MHVLPISHEKIQRVSLDWGNLIFKVQDKLNQLHVTRRQKLTYYGYIDLHTNKVVPNRYGICYKKELESVLRDLLD